MNNMQENNEIQKKIKRFIAYFKYKFKIIKETEFKDNEELFKKILYIGIIDAFSKTVFPRKGNRIRFVIFLKIFSGWKNCDRISLPHLVKLLEFTPEPEYSKLRKFAFSIYEQWSSGDIIGLETDPKYKEIIKYWPRGQVNDELIKGVKLESLKLSLGKEPSYHSMTMEDGKDTWQLVYPLGFFEIICETCLKSLKKYLIINNIDPYNSFNFGSYWKEELNQ
jgi:hypothetical protein